MFKNGVKAKVDQTYAQSLIVKKETGIFDNLKKELKEIALKRQDGLLEGTDANAIVEDNVRGSMRLQDAVNLLLPEEKIKALTEEACASVSSETMEVVLAMILTITRQLEDFVTVSITKMADRVGKTTIEEVVDYKTTKFGKIRFKKL